MAIRRNENIKISEVVESHRPKNYKYFYIMHDDATYTDLQNEGYDIANLDTIKNPHLIEAAQKASYKYYEREIVARAKEPTVLEKGVILSKKMATKTDKKLTQVGVGFFEHDDVSYVAVKLCYEKFDILEIFILT